MKTREELDQLLAEYRREAQTIRAAIADIMWYMRGSVSREEAWTLSHEERQDYLKLIEERVKAVKETGLPLL